MDDLDALLARYRALAAKVDAFAAEVERRHGDEMACGVGCDGCCRTRLSVTAIEAAAIRAHLAAIALEDPDARARLRDLATRAPEGADDRCAALDPAGRCSIYAARPLVCRSHGLPIRTRDARGLPVISSCALNFVARGPGAVDAASVLDQQTLSTILFALDAALAKLEGEPAGARVDLAALLGESA